MTKLTLLLLTIFVLSTISFAAELTANHEEIKVLWSVWKDTHSKDYMGVEEHDRRKIFTDNYNKVMAHNANSSNTVVLALNQFADLTADEWKSIHVGGYTPSTQVDEGRRLQSEEKRNLRSSNPSSVDWRSKGAVTSVQNQGSCKGCWSFAAAEALEALHFIKSGSLVKFSNQQLLDCDKTSHGCSSGDYMTAFTYTAQNGIVGEAGYPFQGKVETCKYSSMSSKAYHVNKGHTDVSSKDASALMSALVSQPVSVAIEANQSVFQFYKSGVITSGCGSKTDHAVLAVGYTTVNGVQAFIVKNSWGSNWGENGYVYISTGSANSGYGVCGILSYPAYPTA